MIRYAAMAPAGAVSLSAILWGLWWIPLRSLEARGLTGDWASVVLYGMAAVPLLPLVVIRWRTLAENGGAILVIGFLFGATFAAWSHAVLTGGVVRATLLFYLSPVWATLFAMTLLGNRPNRWRLASIVFGLGGAVVILGADGELPWPRQTADWMALGSGATFALGVTLTRKSGVIGAWEQTFATFTLAALTAIAIALLFTVGETPRASQVMAALPFILGASWLMLIPITWLFIWAAARMDPGRVSILLLFEIVAAAVSAGLLTDEPFGIRELIGGALIVTAGAIEGADEMRRRPGKAREALPG